MQDGRLTLHLEPDEGHYVPLDTFVAALEDFRRLVRGLGKVAPGRSLDWIVSDLQIGSAEAAIEPVGDLQAGIAVATLAMEGLGALERLESPPPLFPEECIEAVLDLVEGTARAKVRPSVAGMNRRSLLTHQTATSARRVLETIVWADLGSVEGTLEMISLHNAYQCNIYDTVTGRRVECFFKREHLDELKVALGHRVMVSGLVRYNRRGELLSVKVEDISTLPDSQELPSIDQMAGIAPDISGGLSAEEHIRRLRDD